MHHRKQRFFMIRGGQTISLLWSALVQFSMIRRITATMREPMALAIASIVGMLPMALISPFAGVLVDRRDRRKILIASDRLTAIAWLVLARLFRTDAIAVRHLYIVLAVRSIAQAFQRPAMQASMTLIVPEEKLTRAAGFNQIIFSLSSILWPALGAIAFAALSMEGIIMIDVAGVIIASITLLIVHIPRPPKIAAESVEATTVLQEMRFGFSTLMQHRGVRTLTFILAFMIFIYMPLGTFFPLMTLEHFDGGPTQASIVEIAFGIGMLLGGGLLAMLGGIQKKTIIINSSLILLGVGSFFMGLLPENAYRVFVVLSSLTGISVPLFSGPHMVYLQTKFAPWVQGRVMSLSNLLMMVATPIGLIAAGFFGDTLGITTRFMLGGGIIAVAWALCFFLPSLRTLDEDPPSQG